MNEVIELSYWQLGLVLGGGGLCMVVALMIRLYYKEGRRYRFTALQAELSVTPSLQFTIERDDTTLYIANRVLVEIKTRRVGALTNLEHDNIMELYDSWYQLFHNLREELKNIPGELLTKRSSGQQLISLSIAVLNEGLRPHLTQYHSRFETWFKHAQLELKYAGVAPQEIQKDYPQYAALIQHLQLSSKIVQSFIEDLDAFILKR